MTRLTPVRGIALAAVLASGHAGAQTAATVPAPDPAVERIAALGQLWGTVKFIHPYLAYRHIDWDGALITALPRVRAAKSDADYAAAVSGMLSVLGDHATWLDSSVDEPPAVTRETAPPLRFEQGALVVDCTSAAGKARDFSELLTTPELSKQVQAATRVIIDCRVPVELAREDGWSVSALLESALRYTVLGNFPQASSRYWMHSGYPTQGNSSSGGYYASFEAPAPEMFIGKAPADAAPKNIVVLVNANLPGSLPLLAGLQQAGQLRVLEQDDGAHGMLDFYASSFEFDLPGNLRAHVRTQEPVNADGSSGYAPALTLPASSNTGSALQKALTLTAQKPVAGLTHRTPQPTQTPLLPERDEPYAAMEFPDANFRLLALMRVWNVINLFYPYKSLLDGDWNRVLREFIPKFEADASALEYERTLMELSARVQDTHTFVGHARAFTASLGGRATPAILLKRIEDQVTIYAVGVGARAAGIRVGDVVTAIDGEPLEQRLARFAPLVPASTPQSMNMVLGRLYFDALAGDVKKPARLTVQRADGTQQDLDLPRDEEGLYGVKARSTPVYDVLPSGYGYIDLARLAPGEVDAAMSKVDATEGLVIDIRGYPQGTGFSIAPRLAQSDRPFTAARFQRPRVVGNELGPDHTPISFSGFEQVFTPAKGKRYAGKVVVLINEDAISQSEHTCMLFEAATPVTFIGSPTAGANGDVTMLLLPGDHLFGFTGHDVRHADGRQLQRVGIQPRVPVTPTLAGLRAGRDEVLEAAVDFLDGYAGKPKRAWPR